MNILKVLIALTTLAIAAWAQEVTPVQLGKHQLIVTSTKIASDSWAPPIGRNPACTVAQGAWLPDLM